MAVRGRQLMVENPPMSKSHWAALAITLLFLAWLFRWEATGVQVLVLDRWTGQLHYGTVIPRKTEP